MDPFSLLLIAQSAVSAIRAGCDMLKEGTAVINDFKGEAEGVVSQVRETVETVTGLWTWAKELLGLSDKPQEVNPTDAPVVVQPEAQEVVSPKKNRKSAPPDAEVLQMQVVHDVSQQLGKFFDIQRQIQNHYKDMEETSLHVYEANQNHAMKAIERVEVELQLEEMTVKIREMMVYAPKELKDLYSRFLQMYGKIKEEQEFARLEQIRNTRNKECRQEIRRNFRIDLLMWVVGMAVVMSVLWGMMTQIVSLNGQSSEWSSSGLSVLQDSR